MAEPDAELPHDEDVGTPVSKSPQNVLVLGARGALGAACADAFARPGTSVHRTSRRGGSGLIAVDHSKEHGLDGLNELPQLDAVVWAQGANRNDELAAFEADAFRQVMEANVTFVLSTLHRLHAAGRLRPPTRMVVLSSIWEQAARPGKLSYTVSKAAVGGLVRAVAADLAPEGHLVNAVLPGVTDTPMTRAALSSEQIAATESATGFGRLTDPSDVADTVLWLCSPANRSVTGQSITVDLGFSRVRRL